MGESHETSSEHGQIIKNYKIRRQNDKIYFKYREKYFA